MIRSVAIGAVFLACGVLAGTSSSQAQPPKSVAASSGQIGQTGWWEQGWGFTAPGVYREQNPVVRRRLASLFHLAHAEAAARACSEVEVSDKAAHRLVASNGLGPLSPGERTFVDHRRDALAGELAARVGGEACEWAYENYGPKGAMEPGLIRPKDPETTSSVQAPLLPRLVPLPPRRPADL
ncbi:hypothetical protein [Methylobacterium nigriterrae]|uniref:hypothetical protein n=1 Tax=Methylobacterium nigriterrae TaxID=3127512 RepID=UPI0030140CC9